MKSVIYCRTILYNLICLLCFSCDNNIQEFETRQAAVTNESVSFSVSPATKSTDTHFTEGDLIGVYAVERLSSETGVLKSTGNYADNKCFRYNGATFEAVSINDQIVFPKDKVLDFYVYYPYTTENIETSFCFDAQPDQRDYTRYTASDLLMTMYKEGKSNEVIHLEFIHKMALVEAKLNIEDEKKVKGVTIKNRFHIGVANLADTSYLHKPDDNMRSDIQMLRYFDDGASVIYRALMPCQSIDKGELLFVIETENGTRSFQATSSAKLQSGTKNSFELSGEFAQQRYTVYLAYNYGGIAFLDNWMTEGEFNYGDECILHAKENESYFLEGWYEHGIKISDKPHWGFMVTEDRVIEARFEPLDVHVWLDFLGMGTGLAGEGSLAYGSARLSMKYNKDGRWWNYNPEAAMAVEASFRVLEQDRVSGADIGYRTFRDYPFKREIFTPDIFNLYYWDLPLVSSNRMADLTDIYNLKLYGSDYGVPRNYIFNRDEVRFYRMNPSGNEESYELIKTLVNQNIDVF
ncbi:fimbrillin family protein [Dysgonomonas sp. ZJ709]|uniref:fimbrillin family protein n=1 Tax=Dysgonomonas sp. ZJ709 TaxID=2709797 RepID=UPI0013EBF761|nr:fimbrillin family protein [Dysgonomonas sp. ZJ709]